METRAKLKQTGFDFVDHGTAADIAETQANMEKSGDKFEFHVLVEDWFGIEVHILAAKRVSLTKKKILETQNKQKGDL